MEFWASGVVQTLLIVISLIAVAAGLRVALPPLQRISVPDAVVAGAIGMLLGPSALAVLPFSPAHLEVLIYHLLALVFIAVSLQTPPPGKPSKTALSIAFAIATIACLQGAIGLGVVLGWNVFAGGPELHTGFGMLLPLGFNQGPGPALTFGSAWERDAGMQHGAALGLIMAALGYAWCCVIGVFVVAWGRHRGWHLSKGRDESDHDAVVMDTPRTKHAQPGELEPLSAQLVAIAVVYAVTWLFLELVTPRVPEKLATILWSFHFLIATGFALTLRPLAARLPGGSPLDNELLTRTSSVIVDVATCAALAAVSITVLGDYWLPMLLISSLGGVMTLLTCMWMARRAFPSRPFEHAIVAYGSLTGTATTGLALLRMLDPQLEGPAARNYVLASPLAAGLALPLFALIQMPVSGFPGDYPGKALLVLGLLIAYALGLLVIWRVFAPLRFGRAPWKLWSE
jgi:ESS family glutamate:Na+ symporter